MGNVRPASESLGFHYFEYFGGYKQVFFKDKAHFIEMAFGSLMEVSSQFDIAEELGYISTEERMSMDEGRELNYMVRRSRW